MAECNIKPPKQAEESCEYANSAAKVAVKETFAILGVDVDSPKEVEEFRKSLRFGESLRRAADKGVCAVYAVAFIALFWAMIEGMILKIRGG